LLPPVQPEFVIDECIYVGRYDSLQRDRSFTQKQQKVAYHSDVASLCSRLLVRFFEAGSKPGEPFFDLL
jgi:hypothetical protein